MDIDAKPPANVNQIAPNLRIEFDINNVKTPVLIDTGASINLKDLKSWQKIKSTKFNNSLKLTKAHDRILVMVLLNLLSCQKNLMGCLKQSIK